MQQTIPLNKLVLSPRNVRKTNGEEDIAGLADSIAAEGLLQNLVVSQADDGKTFEVDAGGRRLRALQLLVERKELPKNWPVPVRLIEVVEARQASLAENLQKVSMNPADEVEGYAALIADWARDGMDEHTAVINCARRFGQTERYVRQRLALAALAPEILDALREGTIGLAAASAYASHPDHAQQLKVFNAHEKKHEGAYGKHDPRSIRDELKGRLYTLDDRLVRYIGLEAYRAAGGRTAPDLFFTDDEREVLVDTAVVEQLATEKGAVQAQQLAQAEGWLDGVLQPVTGFMYQQPKPPAGYRVVYAPGEEQRPAKRRAEAIAVYRINDDATMVLHPQYILEKIPEPTAEGAASSSTYKPETEEERQARYRMTEIRNRAFRLAIPKAAGTPLEGRLFFEPLEYWQEEFEEDPSDPTMVLGQILVRVPKAELEAQMAEAERRYELEQQELREEEEALAAEAGENVGPEDEAEQDPTINDEAATAPAAA